MNRIVEKVNFAIPKQPKAKRVAAYARLQKKFTVDFLSKKMKIN